MSESIPGMFRLSEDAVTELNSVAGSSAEIIDANFGTATNDDAPLRCNHPGCTNAVVKPARGRTPKYCPEHKSGNSRSNSGAAKSVGNSGKRWNRATEIETILITYVEGIGTGMQFLPALADDGKIIEMQMPDVVRELVKLAHDDSRIRKYLEYLATPGKYAPLTLACMSVIIPILANRFSHQQTDS